MRCPRLLTNVVVLAAVLCGLGSVAFAARGLSQVDPAMDAPRPFGNVPVNGLAATATVTIRSSGGGGNTTITALTGGAGCGEFTASPPGGTFPLVIVNNTNAVIDLTYDPIDRNMDSCTFAVVSDAPAFGFSMTGTGTASLLAVQTPSPPAALTFADQAYNTGLGEIKNITIVNNGNQSITNADITASLPANPDFTIGVLVGLPIAPAGTATLPVTFNPGSIGNKSGTVTFTVTNDLAGDPSPTVTISGKGTQSIATVPASVVFAAGAVGVGRNANLAVMNTGDAPLNIMSMTIANLPNGPDFKFTNPAGCANSQTCNTPGAIAPGATTTFILTCTPSAAGLRGGIMTIASDDGTTGTRTVALKCVGNNLALGNNKVGSAPSAPQNLSVANASAATITYSVTSSVSPEFTVTCAGGCAGRMLASGASETVAVTFAATAAGARTSNLTITTSDADVLSSVVTATGTGTQGTIAVAANPLAFGDVPVIQVNGATVNATITNGGTASLVISQMVINNDAASEFSFANGGGCTSGHTCSDTITVSNVGPGNTATVTVRCDPSSAGDKTANLVINSDAAASPTTVPLTCTGTVPDVVVSDMLLDFGNQRVGVASAPAKTFTVSNSAAAHTAPMAYTVSETSSEYSITCTGAANCTGSLNANQSITVSVTFLPTSAGVKADNITVVTPDDPDEPMTLVMVTGTGRLPSIAVAPSPLAVGDVPVAQVNGATSATTVTNDGLVALVVSSMAITGDAGGNFSFATAACPNGATCNTPFTLQAVAAPGNQAAVTLRCDPSTAGDKTANLVITSDAVASPTTVPVTCTGTVPDVVVSTMMLDFGNQRVATTSVAKTFTVSNSAAAHTAPMAYTVSEVSADYAITCTGAANCTGTLAAGESITVSATFTPTGTGVKAANITVATPTDPDEASTLVMVTGTGTEPAVTVDAPAPAPLAIGDVNVNATSGPGTITLRNSGTADLLITAVTLTGGDAAQFAIATGATGAQSLASTAGMNTRSWTVTCTPTSIAAKSTTFRVTHDAPIAGTQTNVIVTCVGRAAIFTPSIVAPAVIDFGQVQVGMPSIARSFQLTNTGNKAGKVTMLTSTFNVFAPTTAANLALDIAPGGFITVNVVFTPADSSVVTGSVCGLNTGLVSPACVTVTGDGQSVGIDVTPSIDFGAVRFDAAAVTSGNVTITNTGESSLQINTITSSGAPFTIVNGPALPVSLNLNQTTTFKVRLTPTMALGTVTKTANVGGVFTVSGAMASSSIQVTARITAPQVSMTADMIDFGMFDVDDDGPMIRTITITNTGDAVTGSDLHIGAPILVAGAPDFAIVNGAAAIVAPGASANLTVRFDPVTAGPKTGTVTLGMDAITGLTYTVTLRGQAIDQNVVCNPGTITFPSTVRLQATEPIAATVTNLDFATGSGSAAMLTYSTTITGVNKDDFSLPAADATGTIAGNAMKSLPITFRPSAAGPGRSATLVVTYSDNGTQSCSITLLGAGRLRQVAVAPTGDLDFGTIATGSTVTLSQVASMLQLTSTEPPGATAAIVTKLLVTGTGKDAFAVIGGDTATPLPTGGRVAYDVTFSPTNAGDFAADIELYFDEDPTAQYTLHVTGRAVDIDLHGGGCDSGGGGAGALVGLAALGLLIPWRRRRGALIGLATVALVAGVGAGSASAQTDRGRLDASTFAPVAATEPRMFTVLSPLIGGGGSWALDISLQHDANPLTAGGGDMGGAGLIERRDSLTLGFAYALSRKLELGLSLPIHSQSGCGDQAGCLMQGGVRGPVGPSGMTLGDAAVRVKANLLTGSTSFGAALAVTAPTAKADSFAGSAGPTAHLQALLGLAAGKRVDLAINAGLRARGSSEVLGAKQGTELTYGAAASFRALDKVWAIGEAYGALGIVGAEGNVSPTSFLLGVRYRASSSLLIGLGGGGGFGQGIGVPEFRGFATLALAPGARPLEPLHVYVPPPPADTRDNDGDGVINTADKCPEEPEDKDGFEDTDGCPDRDNDGDGIADAADKCPNEPEDKDGFQDGDGCIDRDDDGDGIADVDDRCPKEPEDMDGYNDNDGCDDPDNDHDGVPDVLDQCALEPETINGNNDDDGCPDAGDSLVMVMQDRIEALEPVTFTGTTAKLTKGALAVLDQIARTLRADQSIKKIRVTVHVQPRNDGDQALSDRRAEELRKWFLQAGVEPERLEARGIGSQRPLVKATAKNAEQINDRVEFIIFERRTEPTTTPPKPPKTPTAPTPADSLN